MRTKAVILSILTLSILTWSYLQFKHNENVPAGKALSADLQNSSPSTVINDTQSESNSEELLELKKISKPQLDNIQIIDLNPSDTHRKIATNVVKKTLNGHYQRTPLNSERSKISYARYLEMLDGNKQYFLASDIAEFAHFEDEFINALRTGKSSFAFDIFKRYQERARDRMQFSLKLLDNEPELNSDEKYVFERDDQEWASDKKAWDKLWEQRVKNDVINQFLADKDWEKSKKSLSSRYKTLLRQVDQQRANDVFQLFLNAYIDTLDPHSAYFNPRNEEERNIQAGLTYTGIGATLSIEDEYVTVSNIIPGGPAEQTELVKVDDHIIGVGQSAKEIEEVFGWRLDDVVELIRGPKDSNVYLRLIRDVAGSGETELEIELTRNQITLEAQAAKKEIIEIERDGVKTKVGLIDVPSFYQDWQARRRGDDYKSTTKDVFNLINELKTEDIQGLIIDLRNNGGGNLEEAITLTGLFIDEGPIVQFRGTPRGLSKRENIHVYRDPNTITKLAYDGPLTVLVNRYSASASEIFAAAIQDYERGVILGQTTFGKGTVQEQIDLDDRRFKPKEPFGKLSLTIGKFYRVNGGSTQHRGVIPDIQLPSYIDEDEYGESSEKSALKWDQIKESIFTKSNHVNQDLLANLKQRQTERAKTDPDMLFLQNDIQARFKLNNIKSLSLNLEQRRLEREFNKQQSLERENARRKARNIELLNDFKSYEDAEPLDIQLDQAGQITLDLLELSVQSENQHNSHAAASMN